MQAVFICLEFGVAGTLRFQGCQRRGSGAGSRTWPFFFSRIWSARRKESLSRSGMGILLFCCNA